MTDDAVLRSRIETLLGDVQDPYSGCDLRGVAAIDRQGEAWMVELRLGYPCGDHAKILAATVQAHLAQALPGVDIRVQGSMVLKAPPPDTTRQAVPGVDWIIAVASGKG
ncbi:MAG: hypothetical protein WBC62_08910, partial [Candidatus Macondimonas sp.]